MELTNLPGVHDRHVTTTAATTTTTSTKDKQSSEILPTHYITKLPNLVAINSIAYDSTTHDKDKEEEYYRGYVHNMIRWRYTTTTTNNNDGGNGCESIVQRESNARVVKWSDGTYTLHVGNEILEVDTIDGSIPIGIDPTAAAAAEADAEQKQMTPSNTNNSTISFPGNNGYLYVSQKARICQPKEEEDENNEDDSNENNIPLLYTYQPAGTVLECIAPITARLVPRPSSLASDAHRNLTLAVRQRNVKRARITEIVTEVDPEKEKMARIKGKEDLERSRARGGGGGVGGSGRRSNGGGGGSSRKGGMNQDYLEDDDDDDYDGVNVSNIKKQTRQKHSKKKNNDDSDEEMDYGDDDDDTDDDDDDGWLAKKNKTRGASSSKAVTTTKRILEDGEVDFGDDDDDDDDEEETAFVSKKKKSTAGKSGSRNAFLSDDDEDD